MALHGQYHRGKVNLLLRQGGHAPAPVDYVAFVRGVPAATEVTARGDYPAATEATAHGDHPAATEASARGDGPAPDHP